MKKAKGRRLQVLAPRRIGFRVARALDVVRIQKGYGAFGYHSANAAARDGRSATAGSGDAHLHYDRDRLVQEARRLERDNPIFQGMIDKAVGYIVGNGFGLQAKTQDPEWNASAEAEWKRFWTEGAPEVTGLDAGFLVEQMVCRELLTVGDVGVLKTDRAQIQIIESEQIRGPNAKLFDGLVRDAAGAVTGYWIAPYGRASIAIAKAVQYGPEDFLFVIRRRRPSARRAVPPCQAAFAMLHRINDMCDSEAIAAQLLARLAIAVNRKNAPSMMQNLSKEDDKGSDTAGKLTTQVTDFDVGIVVSGEPGDEIKGIERNLPGKDFPASVEMFLRLLGLPLGLPLEITLLNWTRSNYSQSRAVLEQAFVGFLGWQKVLERMFHAPVYRWAIDLAIAAKRLPPREDRHAHEWIKPTFPWIDQLAEAQAYGAKIDRSLSTLSDALKSQNKDREEVLAQRKREILDAIRISDEIFGETGVRIPWQHLAGLACSVNPTSPDEAELRSEKDPQPPEETA